MSILKLTAALGATVGLVTLAGFTTLHAPRATEHANAAPFAIDPVHSSVVYKINHLGVSNIYGRFNSVEGTFSLEDGGSIDVSVKTDSIDSANDQRDGHLKSPDFFNAKQYPEITLKSTKITSAGADTYHVNADLTMLGKTRPIDLKITKVGEGDRGPQLGHRAGIEATFTIKRSDFGMTYGTDNGALGDEVTIMVGLEGAQQ